jgi:putative cell wall-binding protein
MPVPHRTVVTRRALLLLPVLLAGVLAALLPAPGASAAGYRVERLAGDDRYETAAAVSAAHFAPGVPVTYVATGTQFPDALAGGAAAADAGGPVLLVARDAVPEATATELDRLAPARIVLLGGPNAVSEQVRVRLQEHTSGEVVRLSGPDRYATAAEVE